MFLHSQNKKKKNEREDFLNLRVLHLLLLSAYASSPELDYHNHACSTEPDCSSVEKAQLRRIPRFQRTRTEKKSKTQAIRKTGGLEKYRGVASCDRGLSRTLSRQRQFLRTRAEVDEERGGCLQVGRVMIPVGGGRTGNGLGVGPRTKIAHTEEKKERTV